VALHFLLMAMAMTPVPADGGQSREPPRRDPPARERAAPARPAQGVYFANCTAARAAGRENIRRGEPGYRPALDRDNDGVACESR
jgi:hypothetical protein